MKKLWNEGWSFLRTEVGSGISDVLTRKGDFAPVDIPHDWLIYDSNRLYEDGTGWYLKNFDWLEDEGKRAFLIFEGVYMDSAVYVNGKKVAEWKYGYSTFSVEITDHIRRGNNQIVVSACFQASNSRWYSGAGIYRNVWMKVTESVCIEENGVYISTRQQQKDFRLRAESAIDPPGVEAEGYEVVYRLYFEDREIPMSLTIREGSRNIWWKLPDCGR